MKIVKDKVPVIYKQDIMDQDGKLNSFGAILLIGLCVSVLNVAFKYLSENIVDKDKVN